MEKLKYLFLSLLMAMFTVGFTACGSDDDDDATSSITGTWEMDGSTEELYIRMYFDGHGSGKRDMKYSGTAYSQELTYTFDEKTGELSYIIRGNLYSATVTITGQTMVMNEDGEKSVWKRK